MMTLINPSKHYDDVCLPVDRLLLLSDEREREGQTNKDKLQRLCGAPEKAGSYFRFHNFTMKYAYSVMYLYK